MYWWSFRWRTLWQGSGLTWAGKLGFRLDEIKADSVNGHVVNVTESRPARRNRQAAKQGWQGWLTR
jgi:hypothetical protein